MDAFKDCPFYNERTLPIGAHLTCECSKKACRFETAGRCMIIDGYFREVETAKKVDAIIKHLGVHLPRR